MYSLRMCDTAGHMQHQISSVDFGGNERLACSAPELAAALRASTPVAAATPLEKRAALATVMVSDNSLRPAEPQFRMRIDEVLMPAERYPLYRSTVPQVGTVYPSICVSLGENWKH